jgi:hypothetical protein
LFFNFYGFDPESISVSQLLGATDFTILNGTASAITDLFSVTIGGGVPLGKIFPITFNLEDLNSDVSTQITVSVNSGHGGTVPEPGSLILFATGTSCLVSIVRRSRRLGLKTNPS